MGRPMRVVIVLLACLAWAAPAAAKEFVYVTDHDPFGGYVSQFSVGPFGALAPLTPATVPSGYHPIAIAISRDSRNAYVAGDDGIDRYAVGSHGALTRKEQTSFGPYELTALALTPDGKRLYASSLWGRTIVEFEIGPGGRLTPGSVPETPVDGPGRIVVSPDGRSLYATVELGGSVLQFDIGPDGTLTPKLPAARNTGSSPIGMTISPDARSLYTVSVGSGTVEQFDITAGGLLEPKTPASVPAGFAPIGIVLSPDGRSAYVTNQGDDSVSQYDVGPAGGLTPKSPAAVPASDLPYELAFTRDGRHLYVTHYSGNSVFQYDVGPGGKLTHNAAGDRPATGAAGIAVALPRPTRQEAAQACLFELVAHGRAAFRAKYGEGSRHLHAWRNCIWAVLGSNQ
jgi:DNA-binding beta-propeller fold protein YncE